MTVHVKRALLGSEGLEHMGFNVFCHNESAYGFCSPLLPGLVNRFISTYLITLPFWFSVTYAEVIDRVEGIENAK
jgi:hypothetical protein